MREKSGQAADGVAGLPFQVEGLEQMRSDAGTPCRCPTVAAFASGGKPERARTARLRSFPLKPSSAVRNRADRSSIARCNKGAHHMGIGPRGAHQ